MTAPVQSVELYAVKTAIVGEMHWSRSENVLPYSSVRPDKHCVYSAAARGSGWPEQSLEEKYEMEREPGVEAGGE